MGLFSLVRGLLFWFFLMVVSVNGIGANWGNQATHPLSPEIVVRLLKDNGFKKVKLFDADSRTLKALSNTNIEVMVGIPNDLLATLASSVKAAENWVNKNVSAYVSKGGVNIKHVAVGNEPFLQTYNGSFLQTTFPALQNIQSALIKAGLANTVKVTVPLNADVYQTTTDLPSGGDFRPDIHDLMLSIVKFLSDNAAPFTVNIYPFISLYDDPNFPIDYAFFDGTSSPINDGGTLYSNVFDANHDTLIWALEKNGYPNIPIIVGEVGWPTDGDMRASLSYSQRFNQGFMNHIATSNGTPKRPGLVDAYLFSLIDEDAKSIDPGSFERHWGIFYYDGVPKYPLNLGTTANGQLVPAKGVKYLGRKWCVLSPEASMDDPNVADAVGYACGRADCTSLGYGTTCGELDARGNISYAFNAYYQTFDQLDSACKFVNLSIITRTDPRAGSCRFEIMIQQAVTGGSCRNLGWLRGRVVMMGVCLFICLLTFI